jgi:nucleoside-diphosphate-sugar epimerase
MMIKRLDLTGLILLKLNKLIIFISGSSGIIGKQLTKQLYLTYPNAIIYEICRKNENNNPYCIELDLLNTISVKIDALFNKYKPVLFFHLAWCTNHSDYLISDENIKWEQITINLINSFYNSGGQKFIGIGSSIEYDWKYPSPFNELNSNLNGNSWTYGKSKINIFNYLTNIPNISFQWDRVFFVFGPGQSKNRLIPLIINNAINNSEPLSINMKLGRDYISTFEIAKQISMMSTTSYSGSLNICSGKSMLLGDLVSKIETITQKKVSISSNEYIDNFDVQNISGCQDIIKSYFPHYIYSESDFEKDLKQTIKLIYE